jgi:ABC-type transport system involved in multi-copper enzyme maturation permease subunit
MGVIYALAMHTFLMLRRDKIFWPASFIGVLFALIANLISDWTIEDFSKVLFDTGAFGFHLTGVAVAIYWAAKIFQDARAEGSIEVHLAGPISRTQWIIGSFIGLALALTLLATVLVFIWQAFMLLHGYDLMTQPELMVFVYFLLLWLIVGAISMFFSTFGGFGVAVFASVACWIIGLISSLVATSLPPSTGPLVKQIVTGTYWLWDFQRFNLIGLAQRDEPIPQHILASHGLYGIMLILLIVSFSCLTFSKRDLVGN